MAKLWSGLKHRVTLLLGVFAPRPAPGPERALRPHPWEASYPDGIAWDAELPVKPVASIPFTLLALGTYKAGAGVTKSWFGG